MGLHVEKDLKGLNELVRAKPSEPGLAALGSGTVTTVSGPFVYGPLCLHRLRSGWFPEAYVKPLEEVPVSPINPLNPVTSMNPMSPMNELPSRYLRGGGPTPQGDICEWLSSVGAASFVPWKRRSPPSPGESHCIHPSASSWD